VGFQPLEKSTAASESIQVNEKMIPKALVLIMPNLPFESGEEYLNSELPFLAKAFERIFIVHHNPNPPVRKFPFNIELFYFPYLPTKKDKLLSFKWIASALFWSELYFLIFHYKLFPSPARMASLLGSLSVGEKLTGFILKHFYKPNQHQLYNYTYWCNFMAVGLALLKQKKKEVICISRAHGYDVFFERSSIHYLPLRSFIFKNLDRVYFISGNGLLYTEHKVGQFLSMKVSYLGSLGFDSATKKENSEIQIVSCSAVIELKRISLIIEALSLWESPRKIKWTHFGNGPRFKEIELLAKLKLGPKLNVEFQLMGYLANNAILEFYSKNKIDWFINVSTTEGLPFSIIEACSAGIPSLATEVGGTSEIVMHEKNGFLLPADLKAEDLKKAFKLAFSMTKPEWELLSKGAYETWYQRFRAESNFPEFINDFSSISL
jgi:glycosyltransferase involved in cell wall biosynthesis